MTVIDWVNSQTDKGFSAIHFASYHGNIEMTKFLIEVLGADMYARNHLEQNVVHMAVQGDMPITLVYFTKIQNMSISTPDSKQRTPLHWAIFSSAKLTLEYILALDQDLEVKDSLGYTALHRAISMLAKEESLMLVKTLIVRGAKIETKTDSD